MVRGETLWTTLIMGILGKVSLKIMRIISIYISVNSVFSSRCLNCAKYILELFLLFFVKRNQVHIPIISVMFHLLPSSESFKNIIVDNLLKKVNSKIVSKKIYHCPLVTPRTENLSNPLSHNLTFT